MAGARHMILGHVLSGFCHKMNRCKPIYSSSMDTPLTRCLSTLDITLLGIGHMVGAGIYVLTGAVVHDMAGPATAVSFLLAGFTSMLAALCYAEFGTRIPRAGSAYAYTYVSLGEFWAFIIGWNIILEYMLGAASVARAWSGYLDTLVNGEISNITMEYTGELHQTLLSRHPDILAFLICIFSSLLLSVGVKASAYINNALTVLNLIVITLIIVIGFYFADINNWSYKYGGFMPFGIGGVFTGAATCFYAFTGFDSISAASEEARNPSYSIPRATIYSMTLVTVGYILFALALTLMVPHTFVNPEAAIPAALGYIHADWAKYAVGIGAVCGMMTTLLGSLFSLPRCFYAMSSDGLLFSFLSNINSKSHIPFANLALSGFATAVIALLFDLEKLVEFMSIGTLLAYTIVSAAVIVLRYRPSPIIEKCSGLQVESPSSDKDDSSATGTPMSENGSLSSSSEMYEALTVGRLRAEFSWLDPLVGGRAPGSAVTIATIIYTIIAALLCAHYRFALGDYDMEKSKGLLYTFAPIAVMLFVMFICLIVIVAHQQNPAKLAFRVPWIPVIPAISIFMNVELMVHLNALTWARFGVWMTFGLLLYFLYGIHHSKIGEGSTTGLLSSDNSGDSVKWGATDKSSNFTRRFKVFARKNSSCDDRKPIIDDEENCRRD